jgi:hypothetical protein
MVRDFSADRPNRLWGPPNPLFSGYRGYFPGINRPRGWSWPFTSIYRRGYELVELSAFMAWTGTALPFYTSVIYEKLHHKAFWINKGHDTEGRWWLSACVAGKCGVAVTCWISQPPRTVRHTCNARNLCHRFAWTLQCSQGLAADSRYCVTSVTPSSGVDKVLIPMRTPYSSNYIAGVSIQEHHLQVLLVPAGELSHTFRKFPLRTK